MVKTLHKHKVTDPLYGEPTVVTSVTGIAILMTDSQAWIHASRVKNVLEDPRT